MFNLIRRLSVSVIPRPDRPWRDDATSNAPLQSGRKRRLSIVEPEQPSSMRDDATSNAPRRKRRLSVVEPEQPSSMNKKARSWGVAEGVDDTASGREGSPAQQKETEEVKEVTKGVNEVVLEDSPPLEAPSSLSSPQRAPTPPPESQVETESLEAEKDRDSERSTLKATQSLVHVSRTAQAVENALEADATASELIASPEEGLVAPPPSKSSPQTDATPNKTTCAEPEVVEVPTKS